MSEKAEGPTQPRRIVSRRSVVKGLTAITAGIFSGVLPHNAEAQIGEPPVKPLPVPEALPKTTPSILAPDLNRGVVENTKDSPLATPANQGEQITFGNENIDLPSEYINNIEKTVDIFHDITSGNVDRVKINYFPGQSANSAFGPPTKNDPNQYAIDLYYKDQSPASLKLGEAMAERELTRVLLTDTHGMPGNAVNSIYSQLKNGRSIEDDANNPVFNLIRPESYIEDIEPDSASQPKLDRGEVFVNAFATAVTQQDSLKNKLETVSPEDASLASNLILASINGLVNNAFDVSTDKAKSELLKRFGLKSEVLEYLMHKGQNIVKVLLPA